MRVFYCPKMEMTMENEAEVTAPTDETVPNDPIETTEVEATESSDEATEETPEPKAADEQAEEEKKQASERTRRRRTQRRNAAIERERTERVKAETDAAYWRGRAEGQQPQEKDGKPQSEDFESHDDYLDARDDWRDKQKAGEQPPVETANPESPIDQKAYQSFVDKGVEKHGADFESALADDSIAITAIMGEVIANSENGADIYMHLADNPEEAARIAHLSPYGQMQKIQGIEAKLNQPPKKSISQAPAPVTPERGGDLPDTTDIGKLSTADYIKRRQKQLYG